MINYLKRLPEKILITFLILTSLHLCIPKISLAGDDVLIASSNITKNATESVSTPEINIPAEKGAESGKSSKTWLWVAIAVLAVAGGAALAGSGGGSGDNSNGTLSVTW